MVFASFRVQTFRKTLYTRCTVEIEGAAHAVSDSKLTILIGKNAQTTRGPSHVSRGSKLVYGVVEVLGGTPPSLPIGFRRILLRAPSFDLDNFKN